ncbi:MAG: nucleotidyltransferase family protein [Candidatus Altiarchaeota archaeon]
MMQAAILCGGLATRLRPLTEKIPKAMILVSGKPFLEHQIMLLRKNGVKDIVLCIGHLAESIEYYFKDGSQYGVKIGYSREEAPLGTGGALKNAGNLLADEFIVVYGDVYLPIDYGKAWEYFKRKGKPALTVVYRNSDKYDISNMDVVGGLVTKYEKEGGEKLTYIDAGVSILSESVLDLLPEGKSSLEREVFPKLIQDKELLAYETKQRFYEIGSPGGLSEFKASEHARLWI